MLTQPNDARRHAITCHEGPGLSILRAVLCAVLVLTALSAVAQAQSQQTTFANHHFSGASAVLRVAPDVVAATMVNADPVPIPGGINVPPVIHIFAPGPPGIGMGLDVEPNGITNFNGFAALAYLSGTATDSNNNKYNLSSDMRLYRGEYIAADGTHHRGTFVFIWIDLFDPSSGAQVHDFNGHISQSGLFWIVPVADEAVTEDDEGVHLHLTEAGVIDNIMFLGTGTEYANATIDLTWKATGKVRHYKPGSTNPLDPSDFAGAFRNALATANFTVLMNGVTFTIKGASSRGVFAETGNERNGLFLEE